MHTFIAAAAAFVVGLSLAPPPPPPLGWEENITEGFDPPIEEVLVDDYHAGEAAREAYIEAWGEEAVPVLQRLYADPKWSDYQRLIRAYLDLLHAPALPGDPFERMAEVLAAIRPDEARANEEVNAAIRDAARVDPARARAILVEAFTAAGADRQMRFPRSLPGLSREEGRALLEELRDAARRDDLREAIERSLERMAAFDRAQEPIARILEQERGEDTP